LPPTLWSKLPFLLRALLGTLLATLTGDACLSAASAPAQRTNIVMIIADDMSWHDSGAYGNARVPTPSIDRLARAGMLFRRAFQSTAMCAVTRQQLYTGLDPIQSGAYPQHSWVRAGTTSVFHHLRNLGYRVGLTGKTHVGPPESFPYEFLGNPEDPRTSGSGERELPAVDLAAAENFMARDAHQPFFLVVASHNPHGPWNRGDATRWNPKELEVPPYLVDTPATREALARYYAEIVELDAEVGQVLAMLERRGVADETMVVFTSEQGSSVPFAKWTLYDAGIRTQLIVRWPGRVTPGSVSDAMISYADVTPTFIEAAGGTPPAGLDGRSFMAVLTGASATHREFVHGIHTNFGIIAGDPYPIRSVRSDRYKLIRNLMPDAKVLNALNNTKGSGALLREWEAAARAGDRLAADRIRAYETRPALELYDLSSDPYEMHNLADEPRLRAVRETLTVELDRWMAQQGDRGVAAEKEAFSHINPSIVQWINENYPDAARNPDGSKIRK
jgi:uncharacterized sulfatase